MADRLSDGEPRHQPAFPGVPQTVEPLTVAGGRVVVLATFVQPGDPSLQPVIVLDELIVHPRAEQLSSQPTQEMGLKYPETSPGQPSEGATYWVRLQPPAPPGPGRSYEAW